MKKQPNRLADLFRVEMVWIDKGQGRWVKRRRYHPLMKFFVFSVIGLLFGTCWVSGLFGVRKDEAIEERSELEPRSPMDILEPRSDQPKIQDLKITDLLPGTVDFPNPIPSELNVRNDEYWLRINKGSYELYLYRGIDIDKIYRVAVGKNAGDKERVGDNRTPNGIFTVQSIENSSSWAHDFQDGKGVIRGAYGPWFIRLRTGWKGIGIHGTHDPDSRGTMASEGCIRMSNDELEELKQYAFREMKVVIEE